MPKSPPDADALVAAVVLAAGASSRLGMPKQLVLHRGEPLVRRAAAAAGEAGARPVIVVLGAEAGKIGAAVRGVPHVVTVMNEHWREGIASSLSAGVREVVRLDDGCDGVLITVTDQPFIDRGALRRLLDAFGAGHRIVAAGYSGNVGVPAVIGREHFAHLLALTGDTGAGRWLREKTGTVQRVRLPDAAIDVDAPEDAVRLAVIA